MEAAEAQSRRNAQTAWLEPRAALSPVFRRNRTQARVRIFIVSIAPRIVFFIASHCSSYCFSIDTHCFRARNVSLVLARTCIVIGVNFPLQIDCIFLGPFGRADWPIGALRLIGAASRLKAPCRQRHRVELGLFGANPKAVESNPILKLEIVLMGGSLSGGGAPAAPLVVWWIGAPLRRAVHDMPARGFSIWKVKCA